MAVLIDPPRWPAHGRLWSHLASDVSFDELHAFARGTGVPERGFEGDHYDVPQERYAALVTAGAHPVSSRELLHRLVAAGLRRPKRRGERVLASHPSDDPDAPGRIDTVLSALPPRRRLRALVLLVVHEDRLLTVGASARPPRTLLPDRPDVAGNASPEPASWGAAAAALVAAHLCDVKGPASHVGYLRLIAPPPAAPRLDVVAMIAAPTIGEAATTVSAPVPHLAAGRWTDAAEVAHHDPPLAPLIEVALGRLPGLPGR